MIIMELLPCELNKITETPRLSHNLTRLDICIAQEVLHDLNDKVCHIRFQLASIIEAKELVKDISDWVLVLCQQFQVVRVGVDKL